MPCQNRNVILNSYKKCDYNGIVKTFEINKGEIKPYLTL